MNSSDLSKQSTIYKQGEPPSGGTITTAANLGTGEGVYASNTPANTLNFKSLKVTGSLGIASTANDITIDGSGIIDGLPKYTFSTSTTDSDPGNGFFRLNNATPSAVTFIYLDLLDAYGANISLTTKNLVVGSQLYIKGLNSLTKYIVYTVTAKPTDATTYIKIPVSYVGAGASSFANNDTIEFNFFGSIPSSFINAGGVVKLETTILGIIDQEHAISTDMHGCIITTGANPFYANTLSLFGRQAVAASCTFDIGIYDWSSSATVNQLAHGNITFNLAANTIAGGSVNLGSQLTLAANSSYFMVVTGNNANFALYSKSGGLSSANQVTFLKAGVGATLPGTITFADRGNSGRAIYMKVT